MRLRVALLTLSQASCALSFVHPGPQVLSCSSSSSVGDSSSSSTSTRKGSAVDLCMVASAPTSTVSTQGINGAGQAGKETSSGVETLAAAEQPGGLRTVEMYDTTLRDGTQMEGVSASVLDKLKIALQLHNFGMYVCHTYKTAAGWLVGWCIYHSRP